VLGIVHIDWNAVISLVSLVLTALALFITFRALAVARDQTELAKRQTELAERASRPNLWIRPRNPHDDGRPLGHLYEEPGDGRFGFSMMAGNSGGAPAFGVRLEALIDDTVVWRSEPELNLVPGEVENRVSLYIPSEYVLGAEGRGVPLLKGALRIRGYAESGTTEAWWPTPDSVRTGETAGSRLDTAVTPSSGRV
jgi:hypothetical protein